jgi:hypothetical protein
MHIPKKGIRALGIAESYSGRQYSTLSGIVMRKDMIVDGSVFASVTVGGMDATDAILTIVRALNRRDINVILLSGCVISWFNVIDPEAIVRTAGIPVICVTYEDSPGLEEDIRHHFPADEVRISAYRNLGERLPVTLPEGKTIYVRSWGIAFPDAALICRDFTRDGKIPEPLRVARLCARAAHAYSLARAVEPPNPWEGKENSYFHPENGEIR